VRGYATDAKNLGTVVLESNKDTGNIKVEFHTFDAKAAKAVTAGNHRDAVLRVLGESAVSMFQKEVVEILRNRGHKIDVNLQKPTFEGLEFDRLIVKDGGRWKLHENDQLGDETDD
jgi:hypothetical protein